MQKSDSLSSQWRTILSLSVIIIILPYTSLFALEENKNISFGHPFNTELHMRGAIIQDRDGFIWIGGDGALIRYDGYEQKYYTQGPDSISHSTIFTIYEDSSGIIWIGTKGGLNKYDKESGSFTHYLNDKTDSDSLSSNDVRSIIEDKNDPDILWVGTYGGGLNKFNKGNNTFKRYEHNADIPGSLSSNLILSLVQDESGILWIGSEDGGLNKFDPETESVNSYLHDPDNPDYLQHNHIRSVLVDESGLIWIGTQDGLNNFDPETEKFTCYLKDVDIWNIYMDKSGNLWIGAVLPAGLYIFDRERDTIINYVNDPENPESISPGHISGFLEDSSNIMWIISGTGGVSKFDKKINPFKLYRNNPNEPNSLSCDVVLPIYEDRNGIIWLGTFMGGLNSFDKKAENFTVYRNVSGDPYSLNSDFATAMYEDSTGTFWVGTYGGVLSKFNRENGKVIKHFLHDPNDPESLMEMTQGIRFVIEDKDNPDILWLGCDAGGLDRFDKNKELFKHFKPDPTNSNNLSHGSLFDASLDIKGNLWIATRGGGLNKFDKRTEQFIRYQHNPEDPGSILSNTLYVILIDSKGTLWAGTSGGLERFNREEENFTHYTTANGLPDNVIYGITEDNEGFLWISTTGGLVKFDPAKGKADKVYKKADGMQGDAFIFQAYCKTKDGEMYFGGGNGFNRFYPEDIKDNPHIPNIVLTSFTRGGEELNFEKDLTKIEELNLDWQNNYFSFEFAALEYTAPEKNQYAYMLEGLDKDWNYTGKRRFGIYTSLPGGKYTLRIKGSNNSGVWNEKGVSIKVTVTQPFWKTWWFYTILGVFVTALFIRRLRAVHIRSRKLEIIIEERTKELIKAKERAEEANRAKSDFLANMSHEIRTPMNAILGFTEILKNKITEPQFLNYIKSIHISGKSLLFLIDDILDLSKVEAGKLKLEYSVISLLDLLNEMCTIFEKKAKDRELELIIDIPSTLPRALLLDGTRLRQIYINLIGNAIKFTETGHIKLSVQYNYPDNSYTHSTLDLILTVEDTGIGIPEQECQSIFESFSQLKGQKTSKFGGTGLGLAITRQLVELMNGKITVTSEVNRGSTFCIVLKDVEVATIVTLESDREKDIDYDLLEFNKSTILLVDDIDFNRELLKGFLGDYNLILLEAENGLEAIEKARQYHPDLILLDIKMPEMDGYEAVAILNNNEKLKDIPVIAITASVMPDDEKKVLGLYNSYLRKPINKYDLITQIMKYLPHTVKKETPGKAAEHTKEGIQAIPAVKPPAELLEILKNEIPKCRELSNQMAVDKIEDFAKEMKKLGIKYNYKPLIDWSENLYSAALSFDMEEMRKILSIPPYSVKG